MRSFPVGWDIELSGNATELAATSMPAEVYFQYPCAVVDIDETLVFPTPSLVVVAAGHDIDDTIIGRRNSRFVVQKREPFVPAFGKVEW